MCVSGEGDGRLQRKGWGTVKKTGRKQLCHCFLIVIYVRFKSKKKKKSGGRTRPFLQRTGRGVELKLRFKLDFSSLAAPQPP